MDEKTKKRAKKVVDAGMNIPLANLTETIETNEKLEALLNKDISLPEEIEITLEGVEYIKGEKGDTSEYPSEISIINLPEVQKVEVLNFPEQKAPIVNVEAPKAPVVNVEAPIIEMNNEEVVAELKNISEILSKEEVEGVDRTEIVDSKGETVDFKKIFEGLADKFGSIRVVGGGSFPSQSQMDLSTLVAKYSVRVDTTTEAGITYVGKAIIASSESDAVWQISKIDSAVLSVKWAGGSSAFGHVWNDRVSLTYL